MKEQGWEPEEAVSGVAVLEVEWSFCHQDICLRLLGHGPPPFRCLGRALALCQHTGKASEESGPPQFHHASRSQGPGLGRASHSARHAHYCCVYTIVRHSRRVSAKIPRKNKRQKIAKRKLTRTTTTRPVCISFGSESETDLKLAQKDQRLGRIEGGLDVKKVATLPFGIKIRAVSVYHPPSRCQAPELGHIFRLSSCSLTCRAVSCVIGHTSQQF